MNRIVINIFVTILILFLLGTVACKPRRGVRLMKTADKVDPLIGTGKATTVSATRHSIHDSELRGQTFPAVGVPRGMTQWTPQTRATEEKCLSPYYYEDSLFQGIRASHWKSGSCTQDYGSFTIMPLIDQVITDPVKRALPLQHEDETSLPYFYQLDLSKYGVVAEVSANNRSGLMRFTFNKNAKKKIILMEVNSDEGKGNVSIDVANREINGINPVHRIYQGWGEYAGFDGHISLEFEQDFLEYGVWEDEMLLPGHTEIKSTGGRVGAYVIFADDTKEVQVKGGTSFVDTDGARNNRSQEIPHWNIFFAQKDARRAWNDVLNKIEVPRGNKHDLTMFYTAMYHANLLPRTFSDFDGHFPGFDQDSSIHTAQGYAYYTDFSLWDTFRAVHPLLNITEPQVSLDMVKSLITMSEQGGWMPIFPCWNNYTSAMIGDHATVMISDAYTKGITGFDTEKAWKYMAKNAFTHNDDTTSYRLGKGRRAMDTYLKYGYLPMEEKVPDAFHKEEQVSRTLEYAFDDFATGRFAGAIQKPDAFVALMDRSKNYIHVFDTATGYVRGRHGDGRWLEPFDPNDTHATFITEGTPYQYTWFVPHDMYGLMKLMGGEKAFEDKLDGLFNGGHYWHGNEPGHQIPYLYNYIGKPWKTQKIVHDIVREEYSTGPGGLSGNEDAGQMSAWLVFSMMGLYPVCPSTPEYIMGKPFFEEITIHNDHGKPLTILTKNLSDINIYVQSITLNQQPYPLSRIMHEELLKGGVMEIVMGPEPASDRAVKREFRPMSWND